MTRSRQDDLRTADDNRDRLLAESPVTDRRMLLAGVETAVLEGGSGPPVVLLHGPGGYGAVWMRVIPDLVRTHSVIAPDLPGQGASEVVDGPLDAGRVLTWLDGLLEHTCATPPVLVGNTLGGAIAARFAADQGERLRGLVLVDTFGLAPFEPTPEFGAALMCYLAQPTGATHDGLWRRCAFDLDSLRTQLGARWDAMKAYNLDRACTPSVASAGQVLMEQFGLPAIPPEILERIPVPTALIWGRHDLATRLSIAETASARFGWPLHVIENAADEPAMDQPQPFLRALHTACAALTQDGVE